MLSETELRDTLLSQRLSLPRIRNGYQRTDRTADRVLMLRRNLSNTPTAPPIDLHCYRNSTQKNWPEEESKRALGRGEAGRNWEGILERPLVNGYY